MLSLLHLEKNDGDAALVLALLAEEGIGCRTTRVASLADFSAALAKEASFDLVLSDLSRTIDGLAALSLLRETRPDLPLVFLTDTSCGETIVTALKSGACDYVFKGRLCRLVPAMKTVLAEAEQQRTARAAEARLAASLQVLRSTNKRLQGLIEGTSDPVAALDLDFRYIACNKAYRLEFEKIFGKKIESGMSLDELLAHLPEDRAKAMAMAQLAVRGEEFTAVEMFGDEQLGRNCYELTVSPIRDENGQLIGTSHIARDITERKRAEESLRYSNELLQAVIAASPLATVLLDPDGRVTLWNTAAERIFGWSESEVLGKLLPSIPEGKQAEFAHLRSRVLNGEYLAGEEIQRRQKQGDLIDISLHAAPVRDETDAIIGILAVMADIGARIQFERELRESEQRFRTSFEDAAIGMCLTGPEGRFLSVNRVFGAMLGYAPQEMTDITLFQVTHPDDLDKSRRWLESMLGGDDSTTQMEKRFITREGKTVWGLVSKKLLRDEQGFPIYFVNQVQDITERKSLELQLLHAQKMEAVGTLAGGIAHDFNNLLTAIVGYCSLLEMKLDPNDPLLGYAAKILGAADRGTALIKSLLSFSCTRGVELRSIDLSDLVRDVSELLQRALREDIEFRCNLDEGPIVVRADVGQTEQVLINLATNARDAMPAGGILSVATTTVDIDRPFVAAHGYGRPGRYALLTITDNGHGMDDATRKRIFEPFFTTKEVGKGTGLGLSTVYGIVKQHHGFINCYSEPGRGTTFRIYLPLENSEAIPLPQPSPSQPNGGTETVLLAEDDPQLRSLTREILERFGYTVMEAADGEMAVNCFRHRGEEIQIVILDVIMPRCNGQEAFAAMRAIRPDLPVLFTSGYPANVLQCEELGGKGVGFISKPATPGDLLGAVRMLLDNHGGGGTAE